MDICKFCYCTDNLGWNQQLIEEWESMLPQGITVVYCEECGEQTYEKNGDTVTKNGDLALTELGLF